MGDVARDGGGLGKVRDRAPALLTVAGLHSPFLPLLLALPLLRLVVSRLLRETRQPS